ncbi:MAG: hypothetical protein ACYC3I_12815 [Gemmataceae bacterium]
MWATLALLSAMNCTSAQAGQLELKNARYTYGIRGQERKDSTFLPGDMANLAFDIEGLKVKEEDGSARYSMGFKLINNKKGKTLLEKEPVEYSVTNTLGGSRHPMLLMTNILPDMEPGEYTNTVEIKDLMANTTAKLERKFTVKPLEFGIVRVGFVYIPDQANPGAQFTPAPPLVVPGQNLYFHFSTVGCTEGGPKNQPKVSVKAEIQDESGTPVLKTPIKGVGTNLENNEEVRKLKFIPFQVPMLINRTGKFKILVSATDEISGKTVTLPPLDLTSLDVK